MILTKNQISKSNLLRMRGDHVCRKTTISWPANFRVKKKTFLEFDHNCVQRHRCRRLPTASYGGDTNVRNQVFADQKKDRVLYSRLP